MDYLDSRDADAFWLMFGATLVFFMQCGFAMLEVGYVQQKNTKNILNLKKPFLEKAIYQSLIS